MAHLLMVEPSQVVQRTLHWRIPPADLLAGMPGTDTEHQALPVHVPARGREAGMEAAAVPSDQVGASVATIIREILRSHGGSFDPAWVSHKRLGLPPDAECMCSRLNKLLLPGQLKPFLGRHPEFAWPPGTQW